MNYISRFATLSTIVVFTACASAPSGSADTCRSDLAPSGAALGAVVDSILLEQEIARHLPTGSALTVAQLSFDAGAVDYVRVWSETMSGSARSEIAASIRGAIVSAPTNSDQVYLLLADAQGPALRRVQELRRCAPVLLRERDTAREIAAEANQLGLQERHVVRIQLFVQEDGTVADVRIDQSSGNTSVDLAAGTVFRSARFTPAQIEGIAVPVWISVPVTFTPRREAVS
jgi:TonB family protein